MNRSFYTLLLLGCASAILKADIHAGDQSLTAGLGVGTPLSEIDLTNVGGGKSKAGAPGFSGGFQYLNHVTPALGLGADFNLSNTGEAKSASLVPGGNSSVNLKSAVLLLMVRRNLNAAGPTAPYLFAGLGFHSTTLQLKTAPAAGFGWADTGTTEQRDVINDTQSGVALALGGGVDFYLSKVLFLGLEGRYQLLGNATYSATPNTTLLTGVTGVKGSFGMVNFLARLGYKFGGSDVAPAAS